MMEGRNGELVEKLQEWMLTEDVFEACRVWAEGHAGAIVLDSDEHLLSYTTLHSEFESWIDSKLEKWLIDNDSSGEELHRVLKEAVEREPEGDAAQILAVVLAATDFDVFMQMMRDAAATVAGARATGSGSSK